MKTQAIITSAGLGSRFGAKTPKALVPLKDKPMVVYAIQAIARCSLIEGIILTVPEMYFKDFEQMLADHRLSEVELVVGGKTRCASVQRGLEALDEATDYVVIHDGARPLVSTDLIERAVKLCYAQSAVITAVPVTSTVKKVNAKNLFVEETLDRQQLWEVQTPQVFKKSLILKAHKKVRDLQATDDSVLVERIGHKVKVLHGDPRNIKVTLAADLEMAERLIGQTVEKAGR